MNNKFASGSEMRSKKIAAAFTLGYMLAGCGNVNQGEAQQSTHTLATVTVVNGVPTFDKSRASFSIAQGADGTYNVTTIADGAVTTIPAGTQSLRFSDVNVELSILDTAQTIAPADLQSIIELYIAFFNRVPDAPGLKYWITQFNAGRTLEQIAGNFYDAAIYFSSVTGYSASMTNEDFVKIIYKNVLGRSGTTAPPDADVAYWAGELTNGHRTRGSLIATMLDSAHSFKNDATWGWVADLLDNKVVVGKYFAFQQGLSYLDSSESITKTMAIAAAVTPTGTSAAMTLIGVTDANFLQASPTTSIYSPTVTDPTFLNYYTLKIDAGPTFADGDYSLSPSYSWTDDTYGMADFRGVGLSDLVLGGVKYSSTYDDASTWKRTTMRSLVNTGKGSLMDGTTLLFPSGAPTSYLIRQIAVRDFNGDGVPDMFLSNSGIDARPWPGDGSAVWLSNSASRTFSNSAQWFSDVDVIGQGHGVSTGNITGNGAESVYVGGVCCGTGAIPYFALNDGKGNFTKDRSRLPASVIQANTDSLGTHSIYGYTSSLILDVNGDGFPDLILGAANPSDPFVPTTNKVFLNDGTGHFSDSKSISLPKGCFLNADGSDNSGTVAISTMDVNGDGKPDLVLSQTKVSPSYDSRCIQILINDGTGHFADETSARIDSAFDKAQRWVQWALPVDVNGDGYKDLVLQQSGFGTDSGNGQNQSTVLMNDGTGHFKPISKNFFPTFKVQSGLLQPIDLYGDGRISYVQSYMDFVGRNRVTKFAIYELKKGVKLPASY
jgi:hypothetical protein